MFENVSLNWRSFLPGSTAGAEQQGAQSHVVTDPNALTQATMTYGVDSLEPRDLTAAVLKVLPETAPIARKLAEVLPTISRLVDDDEANARFKSVLTWLEQNHPEMIESLGLDEVSTMEAKRTWAIEWSKALPFEQLSRTHELGARLTARQKPTSIMSATEKFPDNEALKKGYEQGDWSDYLALLDPDASTAFQITQLMIDVHEAKPDFEEHISKVVRDLRESSPYISTRVGEITSYEQLLEFKEHWFAHTNAMQRQMTNEGHYLFPAPDWFRVWVRYSKEAKFLWGTPSDLNKPKTEL